MRDFRKLQIWERAHNLVLKIYETTKLLPKEEVYGLTSQIRRAAVSIPTNIAEGAGKDSNKDFVRYLNIALGSLSEVQYLLFLIKELNYISDIQISPLEVEANELKMMIYSYSSKVSEN
ncbi:MAG: four helix bundle protein [Ignavibacteria bacterium]|nr:four helix bundle protein [Ignavibacteria bacterium]